MKKDIAFILYPMAPLVAMFSSLEVAGIINTLKLDLYHSNLAAGIALLFLIIGIILTFVFMHVIGKFFDEN